MNQATHPAAAPLTTVRGAFWDVPSCGPEDDCRHLGGTDCPQLQGQEVSQD
jgi:hypothetical protein